MRTHHTRRPGLPAYVSSQPFSGQQYLAFSFASIVWYVLSSIGLAPPKPSPAPAPPPAVASPISTVDAQPLPVPSPPTPTIQLAQLPTLSPTDQQGSQVIFNGRSLPVAWSVRQGRIGIADAGLMQTLGLSLLANQDLNHQPVQWFTDVATEPLLLDTWRSSTFRFLDITNLSQRFGWQTNIVGDTLQLTTPPARILGLRQGRQSWGDRIVIDLDRPIPWQLSETTQEWTVTLDGQIDPTLVQTFVPLPGNRLTNLTVGTTAAQTVIRIGVSGNLRPRVLTLINPHRLVIDVRPDFLVEREIHWAPGIRWRQQYVNLDSQRFPVTLLEIDPRTSGMSIKPIWTNPDTATGTAPLITTALRWQAIAAINGGFFNRDNQFPLGAIRQNGRWISGPILNRGAIAWDTNGRVFVGNLSVQETLSVNGQRLPIRHFNSGFITAGLARYTREWGTGYTPISNNEQIVTVQADSPRPGAQERIVNQQGGGAAGQTTFPIPANGYLLVVRADANAATILTPGSEVQRQFTTLPSTFDRYPNIMGAGPLLIQDRQIVLNPQAEQFSTNFITQAAARSAIGQTATGTLMLVTIQNRLDGPGPTLHETAQLMQQLGAVQALNLDGGSSTALYLGGQLLNRSPRTAARVHNGIGISLQTIP